MSVRWARILEANNPPTLVLDMMCFGVVRCRAGLYRGSAGVVAHDADIQRKVSRKEEFWVDDENLKCNRECL